MLWSEDRLTPGSAPNAAPRVVWQKSGRTLLRGTTRISANNRYAINPENYYKRELTRLTTALIYIKNASHICFKTIDTFRVKDHRESERRSVIGRIWVAILPDAKAGRLLCGLLSREPLTTRFRRQSRRRRKHVRPPHGNVFRPQIHIVKLKPSGFGASFTGRLRGLSWLRGNSPHQFLGVGAAATPLPLPDKHTLCRFPPKTTIFH